MTSRLRTLTAVTVAAAAFGAPAAADASMFDFVRYFGSSLDESRGAPVSLDCPDGCTFALDTIGSQVHVEPEYPGDNIVVTGFRAKLTAGSTATFRAFRRDGYGKMTPTHTGETVTGTGELTTYESHMPIGKNETIGIDLTGSIEGMAGSGTVRELPFRTPDGTSADTEAFDVEPLLAARHESDNDFDGLGDATQDPCFYECYHPEDPKPEQPKPQQPSRPVTPTSPTKPTPPVTPPKANTKSPDVFSVLPTGVLPAGKRPVASASIVNPGEDTVSGTAVLKVGGKVVAKDRIFAISTDTAQFKLTPKVAKRLAKGAKAVVSATASGDSGTVSASSPVRFVKGVTTAYDGTYRGAGPLVIKVRGGIVESASKSLLLSSTRGASSMTRTFSMPSGVPAVVSKVGKVEVKGSTGAETEYFKATFTKQGTAKGYLSLWYAQFGFSGGVIQSNELVGASNWTAKR